MPRVKSNFETFNNGIITICSADERYLTQNKVTNVRFGNRTVGISRFWQAKTAGNDVSRLIAVPYEVIQILNIDIHDVVLFESETSNEQYQILQIQHKFDTTPPAMYLSLEKLVHPYKDRRANE